MLGLGFLFGAGLLGAATVAWPIYLHIRTKRNRRIQRVPSLRLFGFAKRQTRRIQLEQLLLMLARVCLLIALFLMLAQPFWETELDLPLPVVAGEMPEGRVLGILVDDSTSAFHGEKTGARLARTKEVLTETIERLPRASRVTICTTTGEFPTPPMSPEDAALFLKGLRPIPQTGNAAAALRNLKRELTGMPACLLVAAPRNESLWQSLRTGTDFKAATPIQFVDSSQWQTPVFIQGFDRDDDQVTLQLAGDPDVLRQTVLEVHTENNDIQTRQVTTHEALHGRVAIEPPAAGNNYYEIRVANHSDHPWGRLFIAATGDVSGVEQVVIFRRNERTSLVADQIITAVIQAFRSEMRIHHLDPAEAASVPQASTIVMIGSASPPLALQPWLKQQITRGVRLVLIPTQGQPASNRSGLLPGWTAARSMTQTDLPIKVNAAAMTGLDELLLLGLGDIQPPELVEPTAAGTVEAIITTRRDQLLLGRRQLNDRSTLWAFGLPLSVNRAGSPAFHPSIPLLLDRVLFSRHSGQGEALTATVGEAVNITDWFQQPTISGTLQEPDGTQLPVQASTRQPLLIPLNQAGAYVLNNAAATTVRLANFPREPETRLFTREQWAEKRPNSRTTWHDGAVSLRLNDFSELEGEASDAPRRRLDLSPVALFLLFAFLFGELILLLLVWRRKGAVSV